jgi:hypothetical protein
MLSLWSALQQILTILTSCFYNSFYVFEVASLLYGNQSAICFLCVNAYGNVVLSEVASKYDYKILYARTAFSIQLLKNVSSKLLLTCSYCNKYQQKVLVCFSDIGWRYGPQFLEPTQKSILLPIGHQLCYLNYTFLS